MRRASWGHLRQPQSIRDLVAVSRLTEFKSGAETHENGYIRVNERLQTSAPGIWVIGKCAGSPKFTHVATDDFRVVRDNLNGGNRTTEGRLVPFSVFTDPELARVGLSELEAQKTGDPISARHCSHGEGARHAYAFRNTRIPKGPSQC